MVSIAGQRGDSLFKALRMSKLAIISSSTMAETPFTISIPNSDLQELHIKLEQTRLPDELEDAESHYGVPLSDIKRLLAYWKDGFDWRKVESDLNAFRQFTRDIEIDGFGTLNIHYIHQRSNVKNAVPLFFAHGCECCLCSLDRSESDLCVGPGSFLEVLKILPLLTADSSDHPSFHVVAFSLPGFGFSEAPKKPGFGGHQYAEVNVSSNIESLMSQTSSLSGWP